LYSLSSVLAWIDLCSWYIHPSLKATAAIYVPGSYNYNTHRRHSGTTMEVEEIRTVYRKWTK